MGSSAVMKPQLLLGYVPDQRFTPPCNNVLFLTVSPVRLKTFPACDLDNII